MAEAEGSNRIADVRFDEQRLYVRLVDGREISVPLWWYPRLLHATPEQRNDWKILPFRDALHWPDIDEDWDVRGFLMGAKAPDPTPPIETWQLYLSWKPALGRVPVARLRSLFLLLNRGTKIEGLLR